MRKMTAREMPVSTVSWNEGTATAQTFLIQEPASLSQAMLLPFGSEEKVYTGRFDLSATGLAVFEIVSPRPIRLWLGGTLVLDEELDWRSYQREVRATILFPCVQGSLDMHCEVGDRPTHHFVVDQFSPSRNLAHVLSELQRLQPDVLSVTGRVIPGEAQRRFPFSLRFLPTQFQQHGTLWQRVLVRLPAEQAEAPLNLHSEIAPEQCREDTTTLDRQRGQRCWYVPVASSRDDLPPLRTPGPETRLEPVVEVVSATKLTVEYASSSVEMTLPIYEALGRLAPQQEYQTLAWPTFDQARALLPEPLLPSHLAHLVPLYEDAWKMLRRLVKDPALTSGLPGSYVSNGSNFSDHLFVWDTTFTTLCLAYGYRAFPAWSSLNVLYSRQFDGGYIHREHNVHDGLPALFEPDFSPNPPLMSVAEWRLASVTGKTKRLARVYPVLCRYHQWLQANRRLSNGTYWTTGLASGLDNAPSLGDGYPCLTAQMAQDAETLSKIARLLGKEEEALAWEKEYVQIGKALNEALWDESAHIYATSLPGGGYNPNKIVTAFWPLWAGIVPAERVEDLLGHIQDPHSFWRHHPLPSLAADSPFFRPEGEYWLGSTWAPTNYAAIKGLQRAGKQDLAYTLAAKHLQRVFEVWSRTGKFWENYSSEQSTPGNNSAPDYSWSALGPIALLLEVMIGLEPDALQHTLRWQPKEGEQVGVKNFSLGSATISLLQRPRADGCWIEVMTDAFFHLELVHQGKLQRIACLPGFTELLLVPGRKEAVVELSIKRDGQISATDALVEHSGPEKRVNIE
jgi:glycogen debranching enzyme